MKYGKLIRMFLVEGDPDGIVTAEVQNMTIFATSFPRIKINVFKNRAEAKRPGAYVLIGDNIENPLKPIVYIGEGTPVIDRIISHNESKNKKGFWDRAIVFTSKDDYLTKTQIQYLESKLVFETKNIQSANLENIQAPKKPKLSEVDKAEMEEFFFALKLLLKTFGYNFLEEKAIETENIDIENNAEENLMKDIMFTFKIKSAIAYMKIVDNNYVVLKGSTISKEQRKHIPVGVSDARKTLKSQGRLINDRNPGVLRLTVDYIWKSPSYASAFVAGGNDNGRTSWKYEEKTFAEVEKEYERSRF